MKENKLSPGLNLIWTSTLFLSEEEAKDKEIMLMYRKNCAVKVQSSIRAHDRIINEQHNLKKKRLKTLEQSRESCLT